MTFFIFFEKESNLLSAKKQSLLIFMPEKSINTDNQTNRKLYFQIS
jgi:hypothetical protein